MARILGVQKGDSHVRCFGVFWPCVFFLLLCVAFSLPTLGAAVGAKSQSPANAGVSAQAPAVHPRIVIKFVDSVKLPYEKGAEHSLPEVALNDWRKLAAVTPGITLEPVFTSISPERLKGLIQTAQRRSPNYRPVNFFAFFALAERPGMDLTATLRQIRSWPMVDNAYIDRGPTTPPAVNAANDPLWPLQSYLDPAPFGINAEYAWLWPGGDGAGQSFVDLEYGWRLNHEDLAAQGVTIISGESSDFVEFHGTAVLGVVGGVDNTLGGVGITPHLASMRVVSEQRSEFVFSTSDAIIAALDVMGSGDVLLLESQNSEPSYGFVPRDTQFDVFTANSLGTALGVVIIEAAGNGGNDLDTYESESFGQMFNPASEDFMDSGVIMVGASDSFLPHPRWESSNYGSRIDCYAWGENIQTCTAYVDGPNNEYDSDFGGTSGASAIIAGAALAIQGISDNNLSFKFSPAQLRALFRNPAFGTPSEDPPTDRIGPMPDLEAIVGNLFHTQADLYIRDFPGDNGDPHDGAISASPDIIVRPEEVLDPVGEFGAGSPGENSITLGSTAIGGQDNFVYVRVKNRSSFAPTTDVTATVYWSPPATLVSPSLWELVGSVVIPAVPGADVLTVSDPIVWPSAAMPGTGHYCFVGLIGNADDPAPNPVLFSDFDTYRSFIRNNNNVTWRNFNIDGNAPDDGAFKSLRFLAPGADDRRRRFCLEVIVKLPPGAKCYLESPVALAQAMNAITPATVVKDGLARIPVNPLGGQRMGCAVFPPKHAFPMRLLVHIPEAHRGGTYDVAVRQLCEGEEVGRVTWRLAPVVE